MGPEPVVEEYNEAIEEELQEFLTDEEFTALTTKTQNVFIYALLREVATNMRKVDAVVNEAQEKLVEYTTPEGIKKLTDNLIGSLSGGMFGSLMGGGDVPAYLPKPAPRKAIAPAPKSVRKGWLR